MINSDEDFVLHVLFCFIFAHRTTLLITTNVALSLSFYNKISFVADMMILVGMISVVLIT